MIIEYKVRFITQLGTIKGSLSVNFLVWSINVESRITSYYWEIVLILKCGVIILIKYHYFIIPYSNNILSWNNGQLLYLTNPVSRLVKYLFARNAQTPFIAWHWSRDSYYVTHITHSLRYDSGGRPAYLDQFIFNTNKQTVKGKRHVLESAAYGKRPRETWYILRKKSCRAITMWLYHIR